MEELNPDTLARDINDLTKLFNGEVVFYFLEEKYKDLAEYALNNNTVIPDALSVIINTDDSLESKSSKNGLLYVFVTQMAIINNMLIYPVGKDKKAVICSLHDWGMYSPPKPRTFLLSGGLWILLYYKYGITDFHQGTNECIFGFYRSTVDIREFLNPSSSDSIFCEKCHNKYKIEIGNFYAEYHYLVDQLHQWVFEDYRGYSDELLADANINRLTSNEDSTDSAREVLFAPHKYPLFDGYRIELLINKRHYNYLYEKGFRNIEEVFLYFNDHNLLESIDIKRGLADDESE